MPRREALLELALGQLRDGAQDRLEGRRRAGHPIKVFLGDRDAVLDRVVHRAMCDAPFGGLAERLARHARRGDAHDDATASSGRPGTNRRRRGAQVVRLRKSTSTSSSSSATPTCAARIAMRVATPARLRRPRRSQLPAKERSLCRRPSAPCRSSRLSPPGPVASTTRPSTIVCGRAAIGGSRLDPGGLGGSPRPPSISDL